MMLSAACLLGTKLAWFSAVSLTISGFNLLTMTFEIPLMINLHNEIIERYTQEGIALVSN